MAFTDDFEGMTAAELERARALTEMRWLSSSYVARGEFTESKANFGHRWPRDLHGDVIATKAPVTPASMWSPAPLASAFVRLAAPFTLIGRLALRKVPFNVPINLSSTPASSFDWVGAGHPKPSVRLTYASPAVTLATLKAGIVVLSAEVVELGNPGSEDVMLNDLRNAYTRWLDAVFVDPTLSASAGVNPASITNGLSGIPSAGSTPDDAIQDLRRLHAFYVSGGGRVETAALLMSSENAVALSLSDPQRFGTLTRDGGTLGGLPVVASSSVGSQVIMIDTSRVLLADDNQADFSISTQTSIEMDDSPSQNGAAGTGASLVSMFQNNLAAIKVE